MVTVEQYLEYTFAVVQKKSNQIPNYTKIKICGSHFIGIIIRQLKKRLPNASRRLKKFLLDIIVLIKTCKNIEDSDKIIKIMCILCTFKLKNKTLLAAYESFLTVIHTRYCAVSNRALSI